MRNWRIIAVGLGLSLLAAAAYAIAYFLTAFDEQYRYGGDNYQVLATIVADRNPGYFDVDPVLGDPQNYRFYRTGFTALVEWAYGLLGNAGQVYGLLAIPFNALRVFGFFLLGLRLFRSPGWAVVLAIVTAIEVRFLVFGEWWGIPSVMYARTAFESVFPYLLLVAINAGNRLSLQTLAMVGSGLATYLHPVSGPPVAFSLWAAMAIRNDNAPLRLRLRNAMLAGLAYAVIILPYSIHFRRTTTFGDVTFEALNSALHSIYPEYLHLLHALAKQLANFNLPLVFGFGAVALAMAWRCGERRVVEFLSVFSAALVVVALIVPIVDHAIAASAGRLPFQIDLVRAAKYLTPIAMIGLVWGAKMMWEKSLGQLSLQVSRGLVVAAGFAFLALNRGTLATLSQSSCSASEILGTKVFHSTVACASRRERMDTTAMYRAIERSVPRNQLVFLSGNVGQLHPYGIRIYSRRPVAWSWKEGGMFAYNNPAAMVEWYRRRLQLATVRKMTGEARSAAFATLMAGWKVRYLVVGTADPIVNELDRVGRLVYRNSIGCLIELQESTTTGSASRADLQSFRAGTGPGDGLSGFASPSPHRAQPGAEDRKGALANALPN